MKKCNMCGVNVDTHQDFCPLCFGGLTEIVKKDNEETLKSPQELGAQKRKMHATAKVFLTLSIIAIIASVYINVKTETIAWSAVVALGIGYVWLLVWHTIISLSSPFKKVFWQLLYISIFLLATNLVFSNNDWLSNYVFPGIAMLTTLVLSSVVMFSKNKRRIILSFFLIIVLLAIVSAVFLIFNICDFRMLNEIALIVEGSFLLIYIIFGGKLLLAEASRKFHI